MSVITKPDSGSFGDYIQHHLHFWEVSLTSSGDFWTFHADSLLMSVLLGLIFMAWFWRFARRATSGVPSKGQAFVELAIEFVDGQVKDAWHGSRNFLSPLALTVAAWVFLMSLIDLVPVDLIPGIAEAAGLEHFRSVPTADVFVTFAMSLTVFVLTLFFGVKAKGPGGFAKGFIAAPFEGKGILLKLVFAPLNILLNCIELIAQPVSLAMRLFGNIYAGELLFMLLAGLMGSVIWFIPGVIGYAAWDIFEILIIFIQTFIFMYLSVVYIAMAQEHH